MSKYGRSVILAVAKSARKTAAQEDNSARENLEVHTVGVDEGVKLCLLVEPRTRRTAHTHG